MVSILAFYSDNLSLNPAGYLNFLYEKTKINKKEAGVGPYLKKSAVKIVYLLKRERLWLVSEELSRQSW